MTKKQVEQMIDKQRQNDENFRIINQNNTKYSYIPLETDILKSAHTDRDANFQKCVSLINQYNEEIENSLKRGSEIVNGPWKNSFYGTLQNVLLEIRFTKFRALQTAFCEKVAEWADQQIKQEVKEKTIGKKITLQSLVENKVNLKSLRTKRSTTGQTNSTQNNANNTTMASVNMNDTSQQSPKKMQESFDYAQNKNNQNTSERVVLGVNRLARANTTQGNANFKGQKSFENMLPSEQIQEMSRDYELGHRTKIFGLEPASERLEEFKRKNFSMPQEVLKEIDPIKQESQLTFPRPQGYLPNKQIEIPPELQEELREKDDDPEHNNQDEEGDDDQAVVLDGIDPIEGDDQNQGDGGKEQEENNEKTLVPKLRPFLNDKVSADPMNDDPNTQFEARSKYLHYKPTNNEAELRMEKKYIENRHKELQEKRESEELVNMVNQWAQNKARLEKEINRKYDSRQFGNSFQKIEFKPKQYQKHEVQQIIQDSKMTVEEEQRLQDLQQFKEQKFQEVEKMRAALEKETSKSLKTKLQDQLQILEQDYKQIEKQWLQEQESRIVKKISTDSKIRQYRHVKSYSVNQPNDRYSKDHSRFLPTIAKRDLLNNQPLSFSGLENQIGQKKISLAKQEYGSLIGLGVKTKREGQEEEQDDEDEDLESLRKMVQPSLSVYSRDYKKQYRPFSAVFDIIDREKMRQEQIDEIHEIKNRMVKYKVNVQLKKLMDSIVIPEQITGAKANIFPTPGMQLYEDIFAKEAKTKKKKKGKK
ncbi:hypothetical protein PPERSA_12045 [Pseudocohnilembus persalinus]|uniref:Uncharacterized protein n=1 Tax=Pseudocohnilembus persalinus TaxID=266149 RepID=A0A0V0R8W6_PSEPJ|nr:hypothetical protein PPERSA_12045 [Pseudocohnilembus persalinus]|eukprot:KRX10921.1 hypothetical protein PPERSA_12045 [Pseudocohnilembus persalinus]